MAKPILLVKFPIEMIIGGDIVNVFNDIGTLKLIEKNISSKVDNEYHVLTTPTFKDTIQYEIISINEEFSEIDFNELKKVILNMFKVKDPHALVHK